MLVDLGVGGIVAFVGIVVSLTSLLVRALGPFISEGKHGRQQLLSVVCTSVYSPGPAECLVCLSFKLCACHPAMHACQLQCRLLYIVGSEIGSEVGNKTTGAILTVVSSSRECLVEFSLRSITTHPR